MHIFAKIKFTNFRFFCIYHAWEKFLFVSLLLFTLDDPAFGRTNELGKCGGLLDSLGRPTDKFVAQVAENSRPFKVEDILKNDARVIYLGEYHDDPAPKKFLINNMKLIKNLGVSFIGMEMFLSGEQDTIDQFFRREIPKWHLADDLFPFWGGYGLTDEIIKVVMAARRENIKIIGIDGFAEQPRGIYRDNKGKRIKEPSRFENYSAYQYYRDLDMAATLAKALAEDPASRALVYVGADHAMVKGNGYRSQPQILQSNYGLRSLSYVVDDRDPNCAYSACRPAAKKAKIKVNKLFIPLDREAANIDGVIFLDLYKK